MTPVPPALWAIIKNNKEPFQGCEEFTHSFILSLPFFLCLPSLLSLLE